MICRPCVTPILVAAVGVLALSSHTVEAREQTVLVPSSNWVIDYAEDKCRLVRNFGTGDQLIEFHIEQASAKPFYNLALFGEPVDHTRGEVMEVTFGPNEDSTERSYLNGDLESDIPFVLMHGIHLAPVPDDAKQGEFEVKDIGPERERAIQRLTLSKGLRRPVHLELGSMGEPLKAMRTCVADLLKTQQLDSEGVSQLATGPEPLNQREMARYIQQRYPARMLREDQGGTVVVQLTVNAEGKPTVCQIARSDRPAAFDDMVCFGLLRTAEFTPAMGVDGRPRFGVYTTSVTFRVN